MNPRDHNGFTECASCAAKPGSPSLCDSCYNNRGEILKLNLEIKKLHENTARDLKWVGELQDERDELRTAFREARQWMNARTGNTWEAHDAVNPPLWDKMDELLGKVK